MNIMFIALALVLIIVGGRAQITPLDQPNGCPPNMITFQAKCFDKIPGCQLYKTGTECLKCDSVSSLTEGKCFITMDLSDGILLASLKPKTSTPKGSTKQIKMTFIDQVNFKNIQNIITIKYPLFADVQTMPSLNSVLKSSFDTYFLFTWTNIKNKTFMFEFGVNYDGTTSQLISDEYDPNLENSSFSKINSRLVQKYNQKLIESTLTGIVSISKNLYKLHYYSDFGFHYISFIQKIPFLEIKQLETVPWKYDEVQMINYIYSQHPFLVIEQSWEIKKRDNSKTLQYEVRFRSESQVVLEQVSGQQQRIIFFKREQNQTISPLAPSSKLVGGYQVLRNKNDEILSKVLNQLFDEFTILKNTQIVKIEYQIVAGTNYLIHLRDPSISEEYICKVFYSLSGEINILEIYLNSVLIHTQPLAPFQADLDYNFTTDSLFQDVNTFIKSSKNLHVPQQILYVNKVKKSNDINTFYQFQIVYEPNSFILASYFIDGPRNGTILLNDFIYNGNNQLDEENRIEQTIEIKEFLEEYRKWLHPLVIEYIKETKPNEYLLKIITEYGSYFYKVINTEVTGYEIYYYELIDEKENCVTHSNDVIQQFFVQQKPFITGLLNNNNNIIDPSSQLVSLSQGIANSTTKYRLLFTNPSNSRKAQVIVREDDNGLIVQSVQEQNNGQYIITNVEFYAKAVEKATLILGDALTDSRPIYGMMNSSNVFLYFGNSSASKQTVVKVTMDAVLQKATLQTFIEQDVSSTCKKIDASGNCQQCKENTISFMSNCYEKVHDCKKQVGKLCLICQDEFSLVDNACMKECGFFM